MQAPIEKLRKYRKDHQDEMISFWKDLVNHQAEWGHEIFTDSFCKRRD